MILLIIVCLYSTAILIIQFVKLINKTYMNYLVPVISFIAIFNCTLNFIINPGIIYSDNKCKEKIYCPHCKIIYPKISLDITHCDVCKICVQGYHHHCGVIGKCVGKNNKVIFMILPFSCFALFLCSILVFYYLIK